MFAARILVFSGILTFPSLIFADDIVTISGKKYFDVHDVLIRDNLLTFTTATDIIRIPLSDIPPALKERYQPKATPPPANAPSGDNSVDTANLEGADPKNPHDLVMKIANTYIRQVGSDMKEIRATKPLLITAANAFSADKMDAARQAAGKSGKAVGFFLLDETLFNSPADPTKPGAAGAFAQFFQTFNKSIIVVFIVLPRDQAKLPPVVAEMVANSGPIPKPRILFTNSEMTDLLHDLNLPSDQLTLEDREKLVFPAVVAIKQWYVDIANSQ